MGLWKSRDNPNWVISRDWVIVETTDSSKILYIIILLQSLGFTIYWEEYPDWTYALGEQDYEFIGVNYKEKRICAQRMAHDDDIVVTTNQVLIALVKLKKSL